MAYKLLITDLDGTLLNDASTISERNKDAIGRAEAKGVRTVISSGRSYQSIRYFEKKLWPDLKGHYGIGFNGGMVYESDTQRILMEQRLANLTALEVIQALRRFDVDILVYIDYELIAEKLSEQIGAYTDKSMLPVTFIEDFGRIEEDVSKVLLKGTLDNLTMVYEHMKDRDGVDYNVFFSSDSLLEFCPIQAHKGYGLEYLCRYLGIDQKDVIAVGDQHNDISMIQAAGLGVAVQNALPEVKAAADIVTEATNDQNAIAEILEKYVLGEK